MKLFIIITALSTRETEQTESDIVQLFGYVVGYTHGAYDVMSVRVV